MARVRLAPLTELAIGELALYLFDIFAAPVVEALALGALKSDKVYLWHRLIR